MGLVMLAILAARRLSRRSASNLFDLVGHRWLT
jgi:hypothetical protein